MDFSSNRHLSAAVSGKRPSFWKPTRSAEVRQRGLAIVNKNGKIKWHSDRIDDTMSRMTSGVSNSKATPRKCAVRKVLAAIAGRHKGLLALGLRRANRDGLEATGRRVVMHLRRLNRRGGRRRPFVGWLMPKLLQMCCKQWVGGCCAQATELTGAQHTAGRGRTRPPYADLTADRDGGTIREH